MNQSKLVNRFVIGTFVTLYLLVSTISTIHVIDFFEMSNPYWLAVTLAIAFEIGAAASLASLVVLDKMNKGLIWALFIAITLMQMQGNMYYAFKNLNNYQSWVELFNLVDEDPLYQKRILSFVSGAILPLVALGFIKSLVDYIKPSEEKPAIAIEENVESMRELVKAYDDLAEEMKDWEEASLTDFVDEWEESTLTDLQDLVEEKTEIEEEKAEIEEMIETESATEEVLEERIDEILEREESLESKIEEVTEDMTNDYIFGKQIYQDAINKTARANAILNARKSKIEDPIAKEESIIEESQSEREIRTNKISSTGARRPSSGTVGMY
jgi:hypothetical protein